MSYPDDDPPGLAAATEPAPGPNVWDTADRAIEQIAGLVGNWLTLPADAEAVTAIRAALAEGRRLVDAAERRDFALGTGRYRPPSRAPHLAGHITPTERRCWVCGHGIDPLGDTTLHPDGAGHAVHDDCGYRFYGSGYCRAGTCSECGDTVEINDRCTSGGCPMRAGPVADLIVDPNDDDGTIFVRPAGSEE
jgi:hypothetical protein